MKNDHWSTNLYLLNLALLITHEIDSAFWKEWELFRIPGGIQLFLILNFLLVLIALIGYRQLLLDSRKGYLFSLLLALAGVFAFLIHGYFILTGHPEFRLPVSMGLLVVILVVSLTQGVLALRMLRTGS